MVYTNNLIFLLLTVTSTAPAAESRLRRPREITTTKSSSAFGRDNKGRALLTDPYETFYAYGEDGEPLYVDNDGEPLYVDDDGEDVDFEALDLRQNYRLDTNQINELIESDTLQNKMNLEGSQEYLDDYDDEETIHFEIDEGDDEYNHIVNDPDDKGTLLLPEETDEDLSERIAMVEIELDTLLALNDTVSFLQDQLYTALSIIEKHEELIQALQSNH